MKGKVKPNKTAYFFFLLMWVKQEIDVIGRKVFIKKWRRFLKVFPASSML